MAINRRHPTFRLPTGRVAVLRAATAPALGGDGLGHGGLRCGVQRRGLDAPRVLGRRGGGESILWERDPMVFFITFALVGNCSRRQGQCTLFVGETHRPAGEVGSSVLSCPAATELGRPSQLHNSSVSLGREAQKGNPNPAGTPNTGSLPSSKWSGDMEGSEFEEKSNPSMSGVVHGQRRHKILNHSPGLRYS